MNAFLKAESLKSKHSFSLKLIFIAPLSTVLLAFLMGGFLNLESMGIYWWYSFILCGVIAIMSALSIQREERAGKFYSVYSMPLNLSKLWIAKILNIAKYLLLANLVLAILLIFLSFIGITSFVIGFERILLGCIAIAVVSLWQIPLCLWLAMKVGRFVPLLLNSLIGLFSTFIAASDYWRLVPYTWVPNIVEVITGIKSSGDMGNRESVNMSIVLFVLCGATLLFVLLTYLTSRWFARQEVK